MQIRTARRALLKLGLVLLAMPGSLRAKAQQRRPAGVVELFTSQGCSRCPPADNLFIGLAERDDLIALAYHVDYWDYLGWKDQLATRANTDRQNAYGEAFDLAVYTPQAVINGRRNVIGSDREKIAAMLRDDDDDGLTADVLLSSNGPNIAIDIGEGKVQAPGAHVILVYFQPRELVKIAGGENEGKVIDYRNIVRSYQTLGVWHGKPMSLELPRSEVEKKGGHFAVLIQSFDGDGRPGRILGATRTGYDLG
jgi:hypothetical protein